MDQIEKYIMTRLYKYVFCPETTDDEKKDLAIQKRIRLVVLLCFVFTLYHQENTLWENTALAFQTLTAKNPAKVPTTLSI